MKFLKYSLFPLLASLAFLFASCGNAGTGEPDSMTLVLSFAENVNATNISLTYSDSDNESSIKTVTQNVRSNKAVITIEDTFQVKWGYKIRSLSVYSGSTVVSVKTSDYIWFAFTACSTYTINYVLDETTPDDSSIGENTVDIQIPEDFIRGFDASEVDYFENELNRKWFDTGGNETEFFTILKNHGVNTIRLRIWNDPTQFDASVNTGMNDLERTIRMAKRVKDSGLDLMLDFHYSDTWADPGRQIVPAAWKDFTSADQIATALGEYTTKVLTAIKEQAGIVPKYVQVGNEINPGMMVHTNVGTSKADNNTKGSFSLGGNSYESGNNSFTATNLNKYLSAGCDAVHAFDSSIKTVIHLASSGNGGDLSWFFKRISSVNYDIIGLSYYPWEESHGTIASLKQNILSLGETFNKPVLVAECSMLASADTSDTKDCLPKLENVTKHMIDPSTGSLYEDLETVTVSGLSYVAGSVGNQAKVIRHIFEETASSGGVGVFTWGGDLYDYRNWSMFSKDGVAYRSLDVFRVIGASKDDGTEKGTHEFTGAYSDASSVVSVFTAEDIASYADSITRITITVSDLQNVSWLTAYACDCSDSWEPKYENIQNNLLVTITSESFPDFISRLKTNGLKIQSDGSFSYTVTVVESSE